MAVGKSHRKTTQRNMDHKDHNVETKKHQKKVGRPQKRWLDDIKKVAGRHWIQNIQDRIAWKTLGKAYVQEWMNNG